MAETLDLLDDLNIDVASPETYKDGGSQPLPKGEYRLRLNEWRIARNKAGEIINPQKPIVELVDCEVAEGPFTGRKVMYQRVFTSTWERDGVTVSGFGDLIRAIDVTANWQGKEGFTILDQARDQGRTFKVKLDWEVTDMDHQDSLLGGRNIKDLPKDEAKLIRKQATIKGMKKFPQRADGSYDNVVKGPSGAMLEAKAVIVDFVRSDRA